MVRNRVDGRGADYHWTYYLDYQNHYHDYYTGQYIQGGVRVSVQVSACMDVYSRSPYWSMSDKSQHESTLADTLCSGHDLHGRNPYTHSECSKSVYGQYISPPQPVTYHCITTPPATHPPPKPHSTRPPATPPRTPPSPATVSSPVSASAAASPSSPTSHPSTDLPGYPHWGEVSAGISER